MPKYLIDVNLPYYFSLWNTDDFIHQKDINETWSDNEVWDYAKINNLIIVTKDADFSTKVLYKGAPPKVIHIRFGNMKMNDFYNLINKIWKDIEESINENNLVNVYKDKIESVK